MSEIVPTTSDFSLIKEINEYSVDEVEALFKDESVREKYTKIALNTLSHLRKKFPEIKTKSGEQRKLAIEFERELSNQYFSNDPKLITNEDIEIISGVNTILSVNHFLF